MKSFKKTFLIGFVLALACANVTADAATALASLSRALDWIADPTVCDACGGYYRVPLLKIPGSPLLSLAESRTQIQADQVFFVKQGMSTLKGHVVITQAGRRLASSQAQLYSDPKSGKVTQALLTGEVALREKGRLIRSKKARVAFDTDQATLDQALYRLAPLDEHGELLDAKIVDGQHQLHALNAWGCALQIKQRQRGFYTLKKGSFTTCPPTKNSWRIMTSTLILDQKSGIGKAYNARLLLNNTPVFYVPYFSFPLDKRRKSGFLFPTYGVSSDSGVMLSIPYYWNIAPNYDNTFTALLMNHRGVQLNDEFRFLTPHSHGLLYLAYLPHDDTFDRFQSRTSITQFPGRGSDLRRLQDASATRKLVSLRDETRLGSHWTFNLNYNAVSDDYYFEDFSTVPGIDPNQLPRNASLKYQGDHVNFAVVMENYQTLHPINEPVLAAPYNRLPEIDFNAKQSFGSWQLRLATQAVNFSHNKTPGTLISSVVVGKRYDARPSLLYRASRSWGYVIPQLQVDLAKYHLDFQPSAMENSPSRVLPIFNIDSGLYFDRNLSLSNHHFRQTLEPRLYYLYVPLRDQKDLPLFDTSLPRISLSQLLTDNRFSGLDRIGDANQLTFSIATRLFDQGNGVEKFHFQAAQTVYFRDRKIMLCTTHNCEDQNGLSKTSTVSPIVSQAYYALNQQWRVDANLIWDPTHQSRTSQGIHFHYQSDNDHIFNIGYTASPAEAPVTVGGIDINRTTQFLGKSPRQQIASVIWPVPWLHRWRFIGYESYDIHNDHALGAFAGLAYNNCCWGFRVIASRVFEFDKSTTLHHVYNNTFYLQFILKGLGAVGSHDPDELLANITGFENDYKKDFGRFA